MLTLWGYPTALNVQKVLWLLEETGIKYEFLLCGSDYEEIDTPTFRRRNPNALVPVVEHNGDYIWESQTIMRFIAATYAQDFWEDDALSRAKIEQWMDWSQNHLEPDLNMNFYWKYSDPKEIDPIEYQTDFKPVDKLLRILDEHLSTRRFIAGDKFSLADIPIGILIHRFSSMKIRDKDYSYISAWYKRLSNRKAFKISVLQAETAIQNSSLCDNTVG